MALLFDQNISYRVLLKIKNTFPNSTHVKEHNLIDSTDKEIWDFAKNNNHVIVTFDIDFSELSNLYKEAPKIIWLRTGNLTTNQLADYLLAKEQVIKDFIYSDPESSCLELL